MKLTGNRGRSFCNKECPRVTNKTEGHSLLQKERPHKDKRLDNSKFVRISNSEIVNLKKVKSLDLSFVGTICMELSNGTVSYVSRRYVSKIKKVLGL